MQRGFTHDPFGGSGYKKWRACGRLLDYALKGIELADSDVPERTTFKGTLIVGGKRGDFTLKLTQIKTESDYLFSAELSYSPELRPGPIDYIEKILDNPKRQAPKHLGKEMYIAWSFRDVDQFEEAIERCREAINPRDSE